MVNLLRGGGLLGWMEGKVGWPLRVMINELIYINLVNVKLYEIFEVAVKPNDK